MSLPVTVIGGYLGAGKTTIINHMLRHANGQRLAVLVNEFGALSIDEDLIEAEGDDLISIAGGCVCCSFGSDLAAALVDLSELSPRPDHVIIEASGVAIPGAIASTVSLIEAYELAGITVLADSAAILRQRNDEYIGDTILRQLTDASVIVQTKCDLVQMDERDGVAAWLSDAASEALVVQSAAGQVPDILGRGGGPRDGFQNGGHGDALHSSMVLDTAGPVDAAQLGQALARFGLARAKGFVRDLSGARMLVQVVGDRAEILPVTEGETGQLVCIGLVGQMDDAALQALV